MAAPASHLPELLVVLCAGGSQMDQLTEEIARIKRAEQVGVCHESTPRGAPDFVHAVAEISGAKQVSAHHII